MAPRPPWEYVAVIHTRIARTQQEREPLISYTKNKNAEKKCLQLWNTATKLPRSASHSNLYSNEAVLLVQHWLSTNTWVKHFLESYCQTEGQVQPIKTGMGYWGSSLWNIPDNFEITISVNDIMMEGDTTSQRSSNKKSAQMSCYQNCLKEEQQKKKADFSCCDWFSKWKRLIKNSQCINGESYCGT